MAPGSAYNISATVATDSEYEGDACRSRDAEVVRFSVARGDGLDPDPRLSHNVYGM